MCLGRDECRTGQGRLLLDSPPAPPCELTPYPPWISHTWISSSLLITKSWESPLTKPRKVQEEPVNACDNVMQNRKFRPAVQRGLCLGCAGAAGACKPQPDAAAFQVAGRMGWGREGLVAFKMQSAGALPTVSPGKPPCPPRRSAPCRQSALSDRETHPRQPCTAGHGYPSECTPS